MKYIFCFFPWVGAVIGVCIYVWNFLCGRYHIGDLCRTAVDATIPLLMTGGIHVDGFMDTADAIHSYSPRERKLEILKDSHIGAFAVIRIAVYGLVFLASFSEIKNDVLLKIVSAGFFLSRCLCGVSAVSFPLAKKDGMLYRFADSSRRRLVRVSLYIQGAACIGLMCFWSVGVGLAVAGTALLIFVWYFYRSRKEFGGVTGDTAGYFVLLCECGMAVTAACINMFAR